jgi:glycerol-3-phosphate dehydrogenase
MSHEWAVSAEDVLWRRTKCGLRLSASEGEALESFMASSLASGTIAAE